MWGAQHKLFFGFRRRFPARNVCRLGGLMAYCGVSIIGGTMRTLAATLMLLALISAPALAAPSRACLTQSEAHKAHPDQYLKYRQVGSVRCWFAGRTPDKSEFKIAHKDVGVRATASGPRMQVALAAHAALAEDDALVGLAGTLCPGACEDLRTIAPKELEARREAAHDAFVEYWLSSADQYQPSFSDRWSAAIADLKI